MKVAILFPLILWSAVSFGDTINRLDFAGIWTPLQPVTKGEETLLSIKPDISATLERRFASGESIVMTAAAQKHLDDEHLVIYEFQDSKNCSIAYKLVLAGWESSGRKIAFGTLYLYQDGTLFNGLPVSFESAYEQ